jgi:hypothetical protein
LHGLVHNGIGSKLTTFSKAAQLEHCKWWNRLAVWNSYLFFSSMQVWLWMVVTIATLPHLATNSPPWEAWIT